MANFKIDDVVILKAGSKVLDLSKPKPYPTLAIARDTEVIVQTVRGNEPGPEDDQFAMGLNLHVRPLKDGQWDEAAPEYQLAVFGSYAPEYLHKGLTVSYHLIRSYTRE